MNEEIDTSKLKTYENNCGIILTIRDVEKPGGINIALIDFALTCPNENLRRLNFWGFECDLAFPTSNRKNVFLTIRKDVPVEGGIEFFKWNLMHASAFNILMELVTNPNTLPSDILRFYASGNPPNVTSFERLNAIKVTVE